MDKKRLKVLRVLACICVAAVLSPYLFFFLLALANEGQSVEGFTSGSYLQWFRWLGLLLLACFFLLTAIAACCFIECMKWRRSANASSYRILGAVFACTVLYYGYVFVYVSRNIEEVLPYSGERLHAIAALFVGS